jgi:hypothetical protein
VRPIYDLQQVIKDGLAIAPTDLLPGVTRLYATSTSTRYPIPEEWKGRVVHFAADDDTYVLFGDEEVTIDQAAFSGSMCGMPLMREHQEKWFVPSHPLVTHVAVLNPTSYGSVFASIQSMPLLSPSVPVMGDGTIISQFQAGHGWTSGSGGTQNYNDIACPYVGTQCASITSGGAGTAKYLRKTGMPALDFTGKMVKIALRFENMSHLATSSVDAVQVDLADSAFGNLRRYAIWTAQAQNLWTEGSWFNVVIPNDPYLYADSGSPTRTAVTDMQVRITDDAGGAGSAVKCYVGQISMVDEPAQYPNGVISFSFDDCWATQFTTAFPLLQAQGFPATIYTLVSNVDGTSMLTLDNLKQLQNTYRWDIAAHAYSGTAHNTRYINLTAAEIAIDCDACINWLRDHGFKGYQHMAYPGGEFDYAGTDSVAVIRQKYKAARSIYYRIRETYPVNDPYRLRVWYVTNATSLANVQLAITRAVAAKEWCHLVFHSIVASPSVSTEWATADFATLCAWITATYPTTPVRTVGKVLGL